MSTTATCSSVLNLPRMLSAVVPATVSALEQESLTACDRGQPLLQLVALHGEHQGRQACQAMHHRLETAMVRPQQLLERRRDHKFRLDAQVIRRGEL